MLGETAAVLAVGAAVAFINRKKLLELLEKLNETDFVRRLKDRKNEEN